MSKPEESKWIRNPDSTFFIDWECSVLQAKKIHAKGAVRQYSGCHPLCLERKGSGQVPTILCSIAGIPATLNIHLFMYFIIINNYSIN